MDGQRYTTIENLAALYATAWGLFIANPMIDTFSRNPKLYAPMLQIVPFESIWGIVFAFGGGAALFLSFRNRRQQAAMVNGLIFLAFAVLFIIGDLTSPAFILFGLIALFNLIHWRTLKWRTSQNISNG